MTSLYHLVIRINRNKFWFHFFKLRHCLYSELSYYCTDMKQVYKIGNSDDLNPSQAVLLIEVSETHCCFAIVDYANFIMVQFGYYVLDDNDNNDILKTVIEEHSELRQAFRQTVVSYY